MLAQHHNHGQNITTATDQKTIMICHWRHPRRKQKLRPQRERSAVNIQQGQLAISRENERSSEVVSCFTFPGVTFGWVAWSCDQAERRNEDGCVSERRRWLRMNRFRVLVTEVQHSSPRAAIELLIVRQEFRGRGDQVSLRERGVGDGLTGSLAQQALPLPWRTSISINYQNKSWSTKNYYNIRPRILDRANNKIMDCIQKGLIREVNAFFIGQRLRSYNIKESNDWLALRLVLIPGWILCNCKISCGRII